MQDTCGSGASVGSRGERERQRGERDRQTDRHTLFLEFLYSIVESMSAFVHEKQLVRDTKVFLLLINVYLCHVSAAAVYQALNVEKT